MQTSTVGEKAFAIDEIAPIRQPETGASCTTNADGGPFAVTEIADVAERNDVGASCGAPGRH